MTVRSPRSLTSMGGADRGPSSLSHGTAAALVARALHDSDEVLRRGRFFGEMMTTEGACGDSVTGSWLGWELRLWGDGRWHIVPAGQAGHPNLLMAVVLDEDNIRSKRVLARALLHDLVLIAAGKPHGSFKTKTYIATLADRSHKAFTPSIAGSVLLTTLLDEANASASRQGEATDADRQAPSVLGDDRREEPVHEPASGDPT